MASRYHFLNNQRPSLGGEIGSALGTGLGTGLAALAESKLDKMIVSNKRADDKQRLVSLGIPDHEAEYLSHQDPDTQWQSARQWLIAGGAPEEMVPQSLDEPWNISPEQEEAAQQQVQQMVGPQQPQGPLAALEQMQAPKPVQKPEAVQTPRSAVAQQPKRPKGIGEAFRIAEEKTPKAGKEVKVPADVRKRADTAIDTSDQMEAIANEMLSLLGTGNVASGLSGGVTPIYLQNDETQQFEALSNELASLLASRSGVATNFKIKLAQSMKPNLRQTTNTQKKLAEKIVETSQQLRNKAYDRLQEYGVQAPKGQQSAPSRSDFLDELPFEGIPAGAEAEDTETGNKFRFDGKQWIGV